MENNNLYQQFRRTVEKSAWLMIFLIFLIESVVGIILIQKNLLTLGETPLRYSLTYIVVPTLINMECAALYHYIEFKTSLSESSKNYFLILVFNTFCLSISIVHNALHLISLSFVLPVFLSAIFGDKKMTDRAFFMSFFSYLFSSSIGIYYTSVRNIFSCLNYIAGAILMYAGYMIAKNIILYQQKNHEVLLSYNKRQEEMIEEMKKDPLTRLYNHNTFYNTLAQRVSQSRKNHKKLSLAIIDIDNFKRVNDTYGHVIGDCVLRRLSDLMRKYENTSMMLARYGGEEFCILFYDMNISEIYSLVEKMRVEFSHISFEEMPETRITFSVGLATLEEETDNAVSLVEKADIAMYQAKRDGKNKITIYEEEKKYKENNIKIG